ncbi:unnamed protein product [Paramecium sonneborni]|uniref:Uncharacterized protein n=1 Tax=Paramecium sonneborni TaxID=65129 RepID=A0A8S1MF72_9CILI|nr:unnamed protein product [Paramecium sonneborni]
MRIGIQIVNQYKYDILIILIRKVDLSKYFHIYLILNQRLYVLIIFNKSLIIEFINKKTIKKIDDS